MWAGSVLIGLSSLAPLASGAASTDEIRRLLDQGLYGEAEEASRRRLAELETATTAAPLEVARALDLLLESMRLGGRTRQPDALAEARRAVDLKEAALGADDPELIVSLVNLGHVHRRRGELELARPALERALSLAEANYGAGDAAVIDPLSALGSCTRDAGDLTTAMALLQRARAIAHSELAPDDSRRGIVSFNLGLVNGDLGLLDESLEFLEEAYQNLAAARGEAHDSVAIVLNAIGTTYWRTGDYERAREMHERAARIQEAALGESHRRLANSLNNLALDLEYLGDLVEARKTLERAIGIWERSVGPDHPLTAQGLSNLGALVGRMGDMSSARSFLQRALGIREQRLGGDHPAVAQTQINLAMVLAEQGEAEEARALLRAAMANWSESLGPEHPEVAIIWENLANLDYAGRRFASAREELETALRIREGSLGPDHPLVAQSLTRMGRVLHASGELALAESTLRRALAIRETSLGAEHPAVAETASALAAVELGLGHRRPALRRAERARDLVLRQLVATLSALTERQALALFDSTDRARPERTLFSGLLSATADERAWLEACWAWAIGRRGIVLEEMSARNRAAIRGSGEAREAWEELSRQRRRLAALWVQAGASPSPRYRRQLAAARADKERAEAELARSSPGYASQLRLRFASPREIAAALPDRSAVVEIVRVALDRSVERVRDVALILRRDGSMAHLDLGPSADIDRTVWSWRQALDDAMAGAPSHLGEPSRRAEWKRAGALLRQGVWDRLAPLLGDVEVLFWVPDGSLHQVQLTALPVDGEDRFLLEEEPAIHTLSSARDLVRLSTTRAAAGRGVLALGFPDFDATNEVRLASLGTSASETIFRGRTSSCLSLAGAWAPLPESAREISEIVDLFEGSEPVLLLHGTAASEERLKREAAGKRVLHLATHGFFLPGGCGGEAEASPLLRSGLALAGANRASAAPPWGEDGILTAEEIASLDLLGAELAVLSACDTGRGDVSVGEGAFGLRRALELAGVRAVVMSQWPVPDQSARRFMTSLYRSLDRGTPLVDAMRTASLDLLGRLRREGREEHPYLWAGFVAAGDWR